MSKLDALGQDMLVNFAKKGRRKKIWELAKLEDRLVKILH